MLSCPPKELPEGLLLGSHWDSKEESSVLVLPAAGHLLRQGQSSPFPWDQSTAVVRVARTKRLGSELAAQPREICHKLRTLAGNCARHLPWEGTSLWHTQRGGHWPQPSPDMQVGKSFFFFMCKHRTLLGTGSGYISTVLCAGQQQPCFLGLLSKQGLLHLIFFAQSVSSRSLISRGWTE